ncbi:MAG: acyl carrier protein, partial [Pirellulaceae bacterium]
LDNRGLKAHGYRREVATRQAFLRHVGVGALVTCEEEMCSGLVGLDTVELVLEIEEAFSINIPDDEASRMVTVSDVFDIWIALRSISTDFRGA